VRQSKNKKNDVAMDSDQRWDWIRRQRHDNAESEAGFPDNGIRHQRKHLVTVGVGGTGAMFLEGSESAPRSLNALTSAMVSMSSGDAELGKIANATENDMDSMVRELLEGVYSRRTDLQKEINASVEDWPLLPAEVGYTRDEYHRAFDDHTGCRATQANYSEQLDSCTSQLSLAEQNRNEKCASSELEEVEYSCDKEEGDNVNHGEYLQSIIKLASSASRKLVSYKNIKSTCDQAEASLKAAAADCQPIAIILKNQTDVCNRYQQLMDKVSCIAWAWEEEANAHCDEAQTSYEKQVASAKESVELNKQNYLKYARMLCMLQPTSSGGLVCRCLELHLLRIFAEGGGGRGC
jgi:hypothetical protein